MKKLVLLVIALAIVFGYVFWKYWPSLSNKTTPAGPVTINFWSLEEEKLYKPTIEAFNRTHANIKVVYKQENALNYRTRVQTQLRANQGPDIFWLHNSWVGMFLPDLSPAPESVVKYQDFAASFYPLARDSLTSNSKVYAIPSEIDGLVMFANNDILKGQGLALPRDWNEFVKEAVNVTVKNTQGQIQTSGAAMGATANVDFWPDLIGLLFFQQPKADLNKPASDEGAEIIKFYTGFITDPSKKTWDVNLPSSTQMFADGKLAFYFGPASQINIFKTANPDLNFTVSPVPQLGKPAAWGSFAALGVSNYSQHPDEAWQFLNYFTSREAEKQIADTQSQQGLVPYPYARTDLSSELESDPLLGAFAKQAPYYKSWYLHYKTLDSGINDEMIALYEKAINANLQGTDALAALQGIQPQIQTTLDKYTKVAQP